MPDTVIFELNAQIARIALNRPEQLNAFNLVGTAVHQVVNARRVHS